MLTPLAIPDQFRRQAGWCKHLGSSLYEYLLVCCAEDYERGGPIHHLRLGHEGDADASALPLRLMGAVHRLVLEGRAPELARFYPSVGGVTDFNRAWSAFRRLVQEDGSLGALIENPVQTNDVGRSGSLLGGFGVIAAQTRLPLRLLEIGASAGLNLCWDRYRYEWPNGGWGQVSSAVRLENVFVGPAPIIPPKIEISERAGCDTFPVDVSCHSGAITLLSYIWADQTERIARSKAAIEIAHEVPCSIDKAHAADWIAERLENPVAAVATVVFHSVVWQYISEPEQERIRRVIQKAAVHASAKAPLAWLRMEPNDNQFEIRLQIYPGFEEQLIATSGPHAPAVRWLLSN